MAYEKFDVRKLERLNDPGRFDTLIPVVMWEAVGCANPDVIVDIGAGTGLFAAKFAELAPGATIHAVDTEQVMLDWMRGNRPEVADGSVVPVLGTETSIPLSDGIADVVAMINLHHELVHPDAVYEEAARLLKPGGRLLVVDWAARETPKGPSALVRVTPEVLRRLLERAGFHDVEVQEDALPWHTLATATR